ncbi:MAG: ABC transporter ATP-binding protein [Proteobacteria bacterium]|nr:ABC transporter ATP-binding protein [Pseudomonadota bacterium]
MDIAAAAPSSTAEPVLAVRGVTRRFGARVAVDGVSLELLPGEVLGLVGPNGAGKTTFLRILAGLLKADAGEGQVLGRDLMAHRHAIAGQVGYMPQKLALYGDLTVIDNLRFRAEVYGVERPREAVEATLEAFDLTPFARQRAKRLSGGWARRLELAAALIHRPRLVLLDEPTAGLDAESRYEVWRRIADLARSGASVAINTHDLTEAEQCGRVALFCSGRRVGWGAPQAISDGLPMRVALVSGDEALDLTGPVTALPGVLAAYPQGRRLRVLARPEAFKGLLDWLSARGSPAEETPPRFEDAAFVLVRGPAEARAA